MHKSAGAIIKNKNGEILMQDRAQFPPGWACPAGHIKKGETPEEGLIREVEEETGLIILEYKKIFHEFVEWNECSKGVRGHDWHVFEILKWQGEVRSSREAKEMKWVKLQELKNLKLEKVWGYWFKKLKII
ncbi:NUDIX hydrolase [Candidatus Parcubacteria bacterium]|nr:NUDIX hydrolase [Candidatus Parcubacteria bacterium]